MEKFFSFESFSGKCTYVLLFSVAVYAAVIVLAGTVYERSQQRYSEIATERLVQR